MPSSFGDLSTSSDIEHIPVPNIISWIKDKFDPNLIENEIGNHILYPEALPMRESDLKIDLAILREVLRHCPKPFYDPHLKKLYIPENLCSRFPSLQPLVLAFIDAYHPIGLVTILLRSEKYGNKLLGTYLKPEEIVSLSGTMTLWVEGKKYQMNYGSFINIPTSSHRIDIKFESDSSKVLGVNKLTAAIAGGEVGLIVDSRTE